MKFFRELNQFMMAGAKQAVALLREGMPRK